MTVATELCRLPAVATSDRVVVIGGGASGTLTALHLLRADPRVHVTVLEPTGRLGCGVAYGTTDERHLLNVRAGNMAAFPEEPGDLLAWAEEVGRPLGATDFLPRREYGDYLRHRLAELGTHRLEVIADRAADIEPVPGGYRVLAAGGHSVTAAAVVLAHGNESPRRLSCDGQDVPDAPWHITDPWQLSWLDALAPDARVVVVGTGLTAIDTAISVLDGAPERSAVMVSRHGLLPQAHIDCQCVSWISPLPTGPLTADQLAGLYRAQVEAAAEHGVDWHHVADGFRGPTQSLWARLPLHERERFLAVYDRAWGVRRHRMAPEIAARLDGFRSEGRLRVTGGGISAIQDASPYALVRIGEEQLRADAVVNGTGPQTDVARSHNPLLQALLRRGLIAPDPLRLGLSCTPQGEVLAASGQIVPGLLTVGPPRKGTLFETTAIPEIRVQAAELATRLRDPHSARTA